jgi:hypothetical protein
MMKVLMLFPYLSPKMLIVWANVMMIFLNLPSLCAPLELWQHKMIWSSMVNQFRDSFWLRLSM